MISRVGSIHELGRSWAVHRFICGYPGHETPPELTAQVLSESRTGLPVQIAAVQIFTVSEVYEGEWLESFTEGPFIVVADDIAPVPTSEVSPYGDLVEVYALDAGSPGRAILNARNAMISGVDEDPEGRSFLPVTEDSAWILDPEDLPSEPIADASRIESALRPIDLGAIAPQPARGRGRQCWPYTLLDLAVGAVAGIVVGFATWRALPEAWGWIVVPMVLALVGALLRKWFFCKPDATPRPWRVVVECPVSVPAEADRHRVTFVQPSASDQLQLGPAVTDFDARLESTTSEYLQPTESLKRVDTQAKWVLASQALFLLFIGGVAWRATSGNTPTGIDSFIRNNGDVFAVAIAALAVSFALAVWSTAAGNFGSSNPNDLNDVIDSFNGVVRTRRSLVRNATLLLAVSLLLAVALPIAAARSRSSGVALAEPTWALNDDNTWSFSTRIEIEDPAATDTVDVSVWGLKDDDPTVLDQRTGLRPDPASHSVVVPLRFPPGQYDEVVVSAWVHGRASADCFGEDTTPGCARFKVPTQGRSRPTISGTWSSSDDGGLTLDLSASGAQLDPGVEVPIVVEQIAENNKASVIQAVVLHADAAGTVSWTTKVVVDPMRTSFVVAGAAAGQCEPQNPMNCFVTEVPSLTLPSIPRVSANFMDDGLALDVVADVMPDDASLRVAVWGVGSDGQRTPLYENVGGRATDRSASISYLVRMPESFDLIVVDASTTIEANRDRCFTQPLGSGCLVVRVD